MKGDNFSIKKSIDEYSIKMSHRYASQYQQKIKINVKKLSLLS